MPRFHCPEVSALEVGCSLQLPATTARHIQVLRLRLDDRVELFASPEKAFIARLHHFDRQGVSALLESAAPTVMTTPGLAIEIAQCLPEGKKMDWIVEKAVELGAHQIQPLLAQRSVSNPDSERQQQRIQRWQAIAIAATEQCGRRDVPTVLPLLPLDTWLQQAQSGNLLFSPAAPLAFSAWVGSLPATPPPQRWLFGPEGGFAPEEMARAQALTQVHLGSRVLRTETAALVALAQWHSRFF